MAQISKEYAEALFALACEEKSEKSYLLALEDAQKVLLGDPECMEFFTCPGIPLEERLSALERAFSSLPVHIVSFMQLLCEKRRIALFEECIKEYRLLLNAAEARVTAKVTSAVALTDAELFALQQKLEKISGKTVLIESILDPDLLGGLTVEIDGTVMDGSLRHRLRRVKEVMNQ